MKQQKNPPRPSKVRIFSLARYVERALQLAEYSRDENGVIIGKVPGASGFFAQGDSFEEARENLWDVIEGNVLLALQLDLPIPRIPGVAIKEIERGEAHAT
ncbi:MAG: type II toxin-antitoxin system HicB family antitoxin [Acidobacteria bacterium]|nr:type II toxin-antitoxin system HicB family antitoxin [Acidobacteriota bacterium]